MVVQILSELLILCIAVIITFIFYTICSRRDRINFFMQDKNLNKVLNIKNKYERKHFLKSVL